MVLAATRHVAHHGARNVTVSRQERMGARSFRDSSGQLWDVFEVHRTAGGPHGVAHGFENGWLAFVSAGDKRRLAPFPAEWETRSDAELESLCVSARRANPPRFSGSARGRLDPPAPDAGDTPLSAVPRPDLPPPVTGEAEGAAAAGSDPLSAGGDSAADERLRARVAAFARSARARHAPVATALLELRGVMSGALAAAESPEARRALEGRLRRWFVDAFYFEGD